MSQSERDATGDGPVGGLTGTPPGWLARSAAAAGLLLGAGHLGVTGGPVVTGLQDPSSGFLAWVFVPVAIALACAAAAVELGRSGAGRRPGMLWACGAAAVLMLVLTVVGFAPLVFGASPASLFLGPGPYALPGAVLFTALTVSALRTRGRTPPPAGPAAPSPGSAPGNGRTRA